jgi:hypothetical protein
VLDEAIHNLECLCSCGPSLVESESVQSLQNSLNVVLSKNFIYKFLYVAFSKTTTSARMRLTQSALLDLPRCNGKSGENFHQDFYENVSDGRRKRDPCVDIKSAEESLDGLEQLDESNIARADTLYSLIRSNVTRM